MSKSKASLILAGLFVCASANAIELKDQVASTSQGPATIKALANGMSLYVFDPDQGSGSSVCEGECAEKWPPVLLTQAEAQALRNPELGVVTRRTKLLQLTIGGRPVYTFFSDRRAGDATGDGLGGVWHVIRVKDLEN